MMSLRMRLFAILALVTALVWGGSVVWVELQTRNEVQRVLDSRLMESARMVSSLMRPDGVSPIGNDAGPKQPSPYDRQLSCQIWSVEGELIARSQNAPVEKLAPDQDGFSERTIRGENWRVYTVHVADGGYRVMVGDSLAIREHLVGSVVKGLLGPAVLGFLALGALIWWSVGAGLKPIRQMTRMLAIRSAEDLTPVNVASGGPDLQPFVVALNDLISRVRGAKNRQAEFTAAAAHELRTPLAGLRIQAQIAASTADAAIRTRALEQIQTSVDRTARLVTGLLTLAREDETPINADERRWIDLVSLFHQASDEPRLRLPTDAFRVHVHPDRFETVIANLLANARTFARNAIHVSVIELEAKPVLVIEDDGPGVGPHDIARLGGRFYRTADSPPGGSGLGLSIVVSTIQAHGGSVRFSPSHLGGLRVELHGLEIKGCAKS
ncbi:ATP-binding protein [Brevundimonas sp.]|uniref:ATP-binding protein n=1 Tax=Brevundimonas sp. TaxID=1871086 RepID=UPI0025BD8C90|nr:ATP-binding protein [Brevundimonas sp.]